MVVKTSDKLTLGRNIMQAIGKRKIDSASAMTDQFIDKYVNPESLEEYLLEGIHEDIRWQPKIALIKISGSLRDKRYNNYKKVFKQYLNLR